MLPPQTGLVTAQHRITYNIYLYIMYNRYIHTHTHIRETIVYMFYTQTQYKRRTYNFLSGFYAILTKRRFLKGERARCLYIHDAVYNPPTILLYNNTTDLCRFRFLVAALLEFSAPCAMTLGAEKENKDQDEWLSRLGFCFSVRGSRFHRCTHKHKWDTKVCERLLQI